MIKVLAIDDEPLALQQLASYIQNVPFLQLVALCHSAHEAKTIIDEQPIDAIFVDINMPDQNGLDFVQSLTLPPLVVFTTAYAQYSLDGYKVNAVDYLLKPFSLDDFRKAALKVKERYEQSHSINIEERREEADNNFFIKSDGRMLRISLNDIKYVEGMAEYVKIYLTDKPKPQVILISMKKMEERLCQSGFFMRIHRSFIINLDKILEVNKNRVIMDEQTYLPIGDLYREKLENYISTKFLGK